MEAEKRWIAVAYLDLADAQAAVQNLRRIGIADQTVSVLYTDAGRLTDVGGYEDGGWEGVLSGFVGMEFPPSGVLVAVGPVLDAIFRAPNADPTRPAPLDGFAGVAAALAHLGVSSDLAARFSERARKGDVLMIVPVDEHTSRDVREVIESSGRPTEISTGVAGSALAAGPRETHATFDELRRDGRIGLPRAIRR